MNSLRGITILVPLTCSLVLPTIAQECVPSAPDGYRKGSTCTVTIDRDNPTSPPNLVVRGGTTVKIVVNNAHGNENITFTPTTSAIAPSDIAGTFLKSAISPLQQLTGIQRTVPAAAPAPAAAPPADPIADKLKDVIGKLDVVWKQLQAASNRLACLEAGKGFADALCSAQFTAAGFAEARKQTADAMSDAAKAELPLADLVSIEGPNGLKANAAATNLDLTLDALATSVIADIQKAQASMQEQAEILRGLPATVPTAATTYTITEGALRNSSITVVAQELLSKANTSLATVTISWQSNPWEISTGILFSTLKNQSYASNPLIVNGVPAPDPANPGKTLTIVQDSYTKPTVVAPLVMANYRLGFISRAGWENKCPNHCAFLLSGGVGLNVLAKTADFAVGPSFQIGEVLFTVGAHIGRDTELAQGLAVGSMLGSSPPSPLPTSEHWTAKLGFAVSYTLPFQ
jgi:hypothetical protein